MPVANIRGVNIAYQILGEAGPFVTLTSGGRRGHQEFLPLGHRLAALGFRVLLHDRRNTGASDIVIDDAQGAEESIWADDLAALIRHLGAAPAFIGGSSAGARLSILVALRHPDVARGLLLLRVTGGAFAAKRLPPNYYGQFIAAAEQGGMAAVCATEQYRERFAANPANEAKLRAMDPARYIAVMRAWQEAFSQGGEYPVMGVSDAQLGSLKLPALVIPGNDNTHSRASGLAAARLIPGAELHDLGLEHQDVPLIPFEQWAPQEEEIATAFASFMHGALAA